MIVSLRNDIEIIARKCYDDTDVFMILDAMLKCCALSEVATVDKK